MGAGNGTITRELSIDELAEANAAKRDAAAVPAASPDAEPAATASEGEGTSSGLPFATRDQLKRLSGLRTDTVSMSKIGLRLEVRGLKVSERNRIEAAAWDTDTASNDFGEVVIQTVIAGTTKPNLTEDDREWIEGLGDDIVNAIYFKIRTLSGLDKDSLEEAMASFRSDG